MIGIGNSDKRLWGIWNLNYPNPKCQFKPDKNIRFVSFARALGMNLCVHVCGTCEYCNCHVCFDLSWQCERVAIARKKGNVLLRCACFFSFFCRSLSLHVKSNRTNRNAKLSEVKGSTKWCWHIWLVTQQCWMAVFVKAIEFKISLHTCHVSIFWEIFFLCELTTAKLQSRLSGRHNIEITLLCTGIH